MSRMAFIILCAVILIAVAVLVLAGTPPRVVYEVTPESMNDEISDVYRKIPIVTAQKVTLAVATSTGYRLPHDYGSSTEYISTGSWVTNGGASFDLRIVNVDGDSVHIFRTGASGGTISLVTTQVGVWGK